MKREYFISINGQSQGPYSYEELGQFVILPNTLIWHKDLRNWTEAAFLKELEPYINKVSHTTPNGFNYNNGFSVSYAHDNQHVIVTTPTERIHYRYADFGERLAARILDGLIIIIPSIFIPFIAGWLYCAIMQSGDEQATVGQRTMGICLLDMQTAKVSFGQATGRFFASILSAFFFFFGYWMFFWMDKKQTLHDNLASTIVVREVGRERIG
ncbi:RDD family protein [Myroides marinus]|jgi:uncharacterized RDD family membrane protein YckC|uniref:Uncharacterized membrane protein YckC, RDD family n=2 Tax=Myroides marinus TaxID=703342 RepID=A0A164A3T3_9FLAO|nr:RDD family protein [Myroides marinus]MDR0229115.1 RDD family protein [Flavobacteriaceae bacterium]KUF45292.1 hypothetical protein AS361_06555 [Myroides marinus]KZE82938.1 hypothetical protein AV926_05170 [Myroides marinus]MDM1345649.1 RDD family protein [Myroides marinus]MDM1351213.1 RDD family protein [Myroides marinus]